ncbi:MAG: COG4315 family predicted lipoprotein [Candidatus Limnocylindrales bacterium]
MTISLRRGAALAFVGLLLAACSTGAGSAAPSTSVPAAAGLTIGTASSGALGSFLTGDGGKTIYVLTKDSANTSTCTSGTCAQNWPAVKVSLGQQPQAGSGLTAKLATITWPDGTVQVTYNGMPLYYYAGDAKAGDTNGQGSNGVWFVAPLSGVLSGPSGSPAASPKASSSPYGY